MKLLRMAMVAAILVPAALSAQQPGANPIAQSFRGFGYFGSWLITAFDSIPASSYGFKPMPTQQTVGYIAQHLEDANYQLCTRFGGVIPPRTARDSLADTAKALWPKDTLVSRLRASMLFCKDAMDALTDASLAEQLPIGGTRARSVLLFVTDLAEHYAQIASYMRILGLVPPSSSRTR